MLFRQDELIFCPDDILIRPDEIVIHPDEILIRPDDIYEWGRYPTLYTWALPKFVRLVKS